MLYNPCLNYAIYATTKFLNYAINLTYYSLYFDYALNLTSYALHILTVAFKMLEFLVIFAYASFDTAVSVATHPDKFAMYDLKLLMIFANALIYYFNKVVYYAYTPEYAVYSFALATSDALTSDFNYYNNDTTFANASADTVVAGLLVT